MNTKRLTVQFSSAGFGNSACLGRPLFTFSYLTGWLLAVMKTDKKKGGDQLRLGMRRETGFNCLHDQEP